MSDVSLEFCLVDLIDSDTAALASFAFNFNQKNILPFIENPSAMSEPNTCKNDDRDQAVSETTTTHNNNNNTGGGGGGSSTPKIASTVRQKFQEMRDMGNAIASSRKLSSGETIGEFLLVQWLEKETKRKKNT